MKKQKINIEEVPEIKDSVESIIIGEVISITDKKEGKDQILFEVSDKTGFELGKKYEIKL